MYNTKQWQSPVISGYEISNIITVAAETYQIDIKERL